MTRRGAAAALGARIVSIRLSSRTRAAAKEGVRLGAYDGIAGRAEWAALERAVEEARLRVPIGGAYPLEQAAAAHARVEAVMSSPGSC